MASVNIIEVSGIGSAMASLWMSKRNYTADKHNKFNDVCDTVTDCRGAYVGHPSYPDAEKEYLDALDLIAKWGAGFRGDGDMLDVGHSSILRFIDITFVTNGLHRGAQDDLDSHAGRFNSIVRTSTRLATYDNTETKSKWYSDKIRSVEEVMRDSGVEIPPVYTDSSGETWVYSGTGYVHDDWVGDKDVMRGNYPLSIPCTAIWKINLQELRHVYRHRNQSTHAAPELAEIIEDLACQVDEWIPRLGICVSHDIAYVGSNKVMPCHCSDIMKVYVEAADISNLDSVDINSRTAKSCCGGNCTCDK